MEVTLHLFHLYPTLLNLYGDRGNIIALRRRCEWRGLQLVVHDIGLNQAFPDERPDLFFMGGDQDREQGVVVEDLRNRHKADVERSVAAGVPFLAVCGSYQLLQHFYRPAEGPDLVGLGLIDAHTIHPGHSVPRCVGNIVIEWNKTTVVGFENHGGRTYLGKEAQPLGKVLAGHGNNGTDGFEGARTGNVFGTYVHGSLLPKNPILADFLLALALRRRFPDFELEPLDDSLEELAHDTAVRRTERIRSRPA